MKSDVNGRVTNLKSRWVVDGSEQEYSLFAPVVGRANRNVLLAWAAKHRYLIHTVDADNAYLTSKTNTPIYMAQVAHYIDPLRPNYVCRLKKALYGLKTSAFDWNKKLSEDLVDIGLTQSNLDQCVFYEPNVKSMLGGHVDDLVLLMPNDEAMTICKQLLTEKFAFKDNGSITQFLGTEYSYERENGRLYMKQEAKIEKAWNLIRAHPNANKVPVQPKTDLDKESADFDDPAHFRAVVGLINYVALNVRPDVAFAANQFTKCLQKPTEHQYDLLCKLVSYLHATKDHCLVYEDPPTSGDGKIHTFVDAGEHQVMTTGKRVTGLVQTYNQNVVDWITRRQTAATADICHAEVYAINSGLKHGLARKNILDELNLLDGPDDAIIPVYSDNSTAITLMDQSLKSESAFYDLSMMFARESMQRGELLIEKVKGSENPADLLTKFVDHGQFKRLFGMLNIRPMDKRQ